MKKFLIVLLLMGASNYHVYAQGCSVCTKTTQGFDTKSANGINAGIIYLAFLPLGIMGTLGFLWWKHNRKN